MYRSDRNERGAFRADEGGGPIPVVARESNTSDAAGMNVETPSTPPDREPFPYVLDYSRCSAETADVGGRRRTIVSQGVVYEGAVPEG